LKANCYGFETGYRKLYFSSVGWHKPEKVGSHCLTQYTMPSGSLIPSLVLFTFKMQVWTFCYILLLCESPLLRTVLDKWLKTE